MSRDSKEMRTKEKSMNCQGNAGNLKILANHWKFQKNIKTLKKHGNNIFLKNIEIYHKFLRSIEKHAKRILLNFPAPLNILFFFFNFHREKLYKEKCKN